VGRGNIGHGRRPLKRKSRGRFTNPSKCPKEVGGPRGLPNATKREKTQLSQAAKRTLLRQRNQAGRVKGTDSILKKTRSHPHQDHPEMELHESRAQKRGRRWAEDLLQKGAQCKGSGDLRTGGKCSSSRGLLPGEEQKNQGGVYNIGGEVVSEKEPTGRLFWARSDIKYWNGAVNGGGKGSSRTTESGQITPTFIQRPRGGRAESVKAGKKKGVTTPECHECRRIRR